MNKMKTLFGMDFSDGDYANWTLLSMLVFSVGYFVIYKILRKKVHLAPEYSVRLLTLAHGIYATLCAIRYVVLPSLGYFQGESWVSRHIFLCGLKAFKVLIRKLLGTKVTSEDISERRYLVAARILASCRRFSEDGATNRRPRDQPLSGFCTFVNFQFFFSCLQFLQFQQDLSSPTAWATSCSISFGVSFTAKLQS